MSGWRESARKTFQIGALYAADAVAGRLESEILTLDKLHPANDRIFEFFFSFQQQAILHPFNIFHLRALGSAYDVCTHLDKLEEALVYAEKILAPYR